jgi:two-component system, OmpR family, phosphate regulon sensor histidine kinase PhoR
MIGNLPLEGFILDCGGQASWAITLNRAIVLSSVLCFGGALLLALVSATLLLSRTSSVNAGYAMLGGAIVLAASGAILQPRLREQAEALTQRASHIELVEAQLEQQRTAVDNLADGLEVALAICDNKANILYANKAAKQLFRVENPVGRALIAVTLSSELEQLVLNAAVRHSVIDAELNFASPVDRVGMAKAWPQDEGNRVFLSVYDITDLRHLERVRRDFVSNVSHELRTPLTIIRSMAETLLDAPDTPAAKKGQYLEKVISEVDRLTMMANDLLVLTTAESQVVAKRPCDIAEIFRGVTDQLLPKAIEKGLDLRYQGPFSLIVPAHTEQLRQVALNLIENAINYTSQGRITSVIRDEGTEVIAIVNDSGIGIASDDVPRIFERFYRVDKGRSRGTGGTGLGLSIVKHIVEAHGGNVTVDSALNVGSTFTIRLPANTIPEENLID